MRCSYLVTVLGFLLVSMCICTANETLASEDFSKMQSDPEIRQRIIGTWVTSGYVTSTNPLESFSEEEMLIYATNGYYSATKTIVAAGRTSVKKCQGFWSVKGRILRYSITNSVGVKPDSEPFFYTQAKVIKVNHKQLLLFEWMDQLAFFERDSREDKR